MPIILMSPSPQAVFGDLVSQQRLNGPRPWPRSHLPAAPGSPPAPGLPPPRGRPSPRVLYRPILFCPLSEGSPRLCPRPCLPAPRCPSRVVPPACCTPATPTRVSGPGLASDTRSCSAVRRRFIASVPSTEPGTVRLPAPGAPLSASFPSVAHESHGGGTVLGGFTAPHQSATMAFQVKS